jgi:ubiquinone/menaquinone biosynthesis C-methylase UbiE
MTTTATTAFDPVWEADVYAAGRHLARYPYDSVVSFVFRHAPSDRPRGEVRILEIGCGAGNNLWFAAREGFRVAGIDGSRSAIEYARRRFAEEGLDGDLRVGDFTALPFDDASFDLVIDRGSTVCVGHTACRLAVREVRRVLVPGGHFHFNPYSDRSTSVLHGRPGPDGTTVDIAQGPLAGLGALCFHSAADVDGSLGDGWQVLKREHREWTDETKTVPGTNSSGKRSDSVDVEADELVPGTVFSHAEWLVIARKEDR